MIADYETLSWPKFRDLDRDRTFLILPVSSTEQHGPHLPVGTDDYILQMFVSGLKDQEYEPDTNLLFMPRLNYGRSMEHMDFPGTVSLRPETLIAQIDDIVGCAAEHGFRHVILLNSHGGNTGILFGVAQAWQKKHGIHVYGIDLSTLWPGIEAIPELSHIPVPREIHAGEIETSLMLYRYPELVDMTKACTAMFELPGWQTGWSTSDFTSDGVMGDAKAATPEKGKLLYDFMTEKAAAVLRELMASNPGRPARA